AATWCSSGSGAGTEWLLPSSSRYQPSTPSMVRWSSGSRTYTPTRTSASIALSSRNAPACRSEAMRSSVTRSLRIVRYIRYIVAPVVVVVSVLLPGPAPPPVESRAVLALQLDPGDHVQVRRRGVQQDQIPLAHPPLDLAGLHGADCDQTREAAPPAPAKRLAGLGPLLDRRVSRPAPDQALAGAELGHDRRPVGVAPNQ